MGAAGRLTAARGDDEGLIELELDGAFWCRVEPGLIATLGVAVGDTVSPAARRRIEAAARDRATVERAASMLARRPYARSDLERRLARRSGTASARRAVERLDQVGALDDRRFAVDLAESRISTGWGPLRIRHDLEQAGVEEAVIAATLEAFDEDRWAKAEETALGGRTGITAWRRLVSRGFDPELLADRFEADDEAP